MSTRISKTKFIAGVQCLKRLYWQVHEQELAAEPELAAEAIIEQGGEIGSRLFIQARSISLGHCVLSSRVFPATPKLLAVVD